MKRREKFVRVGTPRERSRWIYRLRVRRVTSLLTLFSMSRLVRQRISGEHQKASRTSLFTMAILLQTISPSRSNAALKPTLIVTLALMSLTFGCSREKSQSAGDFQKKKECADRAEAYLRHERNIDVPANGINASVKNEQYAYSSALNTCLLYFEAVEVDAGTFVQHRRHACE